MTTVRDPIAPSIPYATPVRGAMQTPFHLTSTARRTGPRRPVSDREAMKQLVDCVGMSARKRVLESGRKPRQLDDHRETTPPGGPPGP